MNAHLQIAEAADRRARGRFLRLPFALYRDDPHWVPPLRRSRARLFAGKTAFFEHGRMALFLARRGRETVGRVAAIENTAHNAQHGDRVGFFGFFECRPDDAEAAGGLLARAERWLAARGLDRIRGPVNPSMNAECGLLIDGFDRPPMALMPYNPPAYAALLAGCGLAQCKDLYAYWVTEDDVAPGTRWHRRTSRAIEAVRRRLPGLKIHRLDKRRYRRQILRYLAVFEEARRRNWGYVPLTRREILETARELKPVAEPDLILFAEVDGKPAGAFLAVPNVNRGLAAAGGRLLPFGFLRFRRAMKHQTEVRVFGIAALDEYRRKGVPALMMMEVMQRGLERGYRAAEASWVLEDNDSSNALIRRLFGVEPYKTYRLYEKPIAPPAGQGP